MKKVLIGMIIVVIILVVLSIIFFGFTYPGRFMMMNLLYSSNCGNEFNNAFELAVKNNDINFCSNYSGDIKWGKDIGYGVGCNLKKTKSGITKNNFEETCLGAMSYSTKNIEFCKLIDGDTLKGSCVLDIARNKGDINYCEILEKSNPYYDVCTLRHKED